MVIVHTYWWAISAALGQEYDGIVFPDMSISRTLHDAEIRYHTAEQEVLALFRVLTGKHTLVVGRPLIVYTRNSVLQ